MTRPLVAAVVLVVTLALSACGGGGNIESRVQDQYADYAAEHGFKPDTLNVDRVECDKEATRGFDGWCRIHPKGFHLTYDVPYRGEKPLWGESGLMKAPAS